MSELPHLNAEPLSEWKGNVDPALHRREMIDVGIIAGLFVVAGLAAVTGFVTWVAWVMSLIGR